MIVRSFLFSGKPQREGMKMRRRRDLTAYHVPPDKEFGSGEESCTTNQVDAKNHDIFCKLGYCDYGHIR